MVVASRARRGVRGCRRRGIRGDHPGGAEGQAHRDRPAASHRVGPVPGVLNPGDSIDEIAFRLGDRLVAEGAGLVPEINGGDAKVIDDKSREQAMAEQAAKEPSFDFSVEAKKVKIQHQNIKEVTINYYLMDLELLFSNNPFVQQGSGQFSFVRPNLTKKVTLEKASGTAEFNLPEQFQQSNVLVEIEAGGKTRAHAYYANSLTVQMLDAIFRKYWQTT